MSNENKILLDTTLPEKISGQFERVVIPPPITVNQCYRGDCLELMKLLDDKSVNLIVTDPPYFLPAQHYATRKRFTRNFGDLGIVEHFYRNLFDGYARVLKDDGSLYMFCDR